MQAGQDMGWQGETRIVRARQDWRVKVWTGQDWCVSAMQVGQGWARPVSERSGEVWCGRLGESRYSKERYRMATQVWTDKDGQGKTGKVTALQTRLGVAGQERRVLD